jgi:hypothetical protein
MFIITTIIIANIYTQEGFKYYNCDGEVTNLNPNFNVTLNREELKDNFWTYCWDENYPRFSTNTEINVNKCNTLANYLNQIIKFDVENIYCDFDGTLQFSSPFICKSNVYKLNHIIYNGWSRNMFTCGTNEYVRFSSIHDGNNPKHECEKDIEDYHYFEEFIRCTSSENGYPDIPYQNKCNCLPGATGPLCQYTDKDTCYCNGKANMNGFCTCNPGYSGIYCNVGDTTLQPISKTYTTKTTKITNTKTTYTKTDTTKADTTYTKADTTYSTKADSTKADSTKTDTTKPSENQTIQTTTTVSSNNITHDSINNKDTATIVILVILVIFIIVILSIPVGIYGYNNCKKDKSIPTQRDPPSYENPVYDININNVSTA